MDAMDAREDPRMRRDASDEGHPTEPTEPASPVDAVPGDASAPRDASETLEPGPASGDDGNVSSARTGRRGRTARRGSAGGTADAAAGESGAASNVVEGPPDAEPPASSRRRGRVDPAVELPPDDRGLWDGHAAPAGTASVSDGAGSLAPPVTDGREAPIDAGSSGETTGTPAAGADASRDADGLSGGVVGPPGSEAAGAAAVASEDHRRQAARTGSWRPRRAEHRDAPDERVAGPDLAGPGTDASETSGEIPGPTFSGVAGEPAPPPEPAWRPMHPAQEPDWRYVREAAEHEARAEAAAARGEAATRGDVAGPEATAQGEAATRGEVESSEAVAARGHVAAWEQAAASGHAAVPAEVATRGDAAAWQQAAVRGDAAAPDEAPAAPGAAPVAADDTTEQRVVPPTHMTPEEPVELAGAEPVDVDVRAADWAATRSSHIVAPDDVATGFAVLEMDEAFEADESAPVPVAAICPFLAADGGWRAARPIREHRCNAVSPPAGLSLVKQRRLCLTTDHPSCPAYEVATTRRATSLAASGLSAASIASRRTRPLVHTAPLVLEGRTSRRRPDAPGRTSGGSRVGIWLLAAVVVLALAAVALARGPFFGGGVAASPSAPVSGAASPTLDAGASIASVAPSGEPGASAGPTPRPTARPTKQPSPKPTARATPRPSASAQPSPPAQPTASAPVTAKVYVVKAGDTLSGIAARFGTTVAVLQQLNGIKDPSLLHIGQKIKLP